MLGWWLGFVTFVGWISVTVSVQELDDEDVMWNVCGQVWSTQSSGPRRAQREINKHRQQCWADAMLCCTETTMKVLLGMQSFRTPKIQHNESARPPILKRDRDKASFQIANG